MAESAIAYHYSVGNSTARGVADCVFALCQDGRIDEARSLLEGGSKEPDLLLSEGLVQYWLASTGRGSFEDAKDLLSEARNLFSQGDNFERELLCNVYLGLCYSRQGQAAEARILISDATRAADRLTVFLAWLSAAVVELDGENWQTAKKYLAIIQPDVESHRFSLQGRFYMHRALAHELADETDAALTDYEQALVCFEQAGNWDFAARIYNNLANSYLPIDTKVAHLNIDPAITIQRRLRNYPELAQCLDTRAQIFIQEGKLREAQRATAEAIALAGEGDHKLNLTKFLITRGQINAGLGLTEDAKRDFLEAADIAELNSDADLARRAYREAINSLAVHRLSSSVAELRTREYAYEAQLIRDALERCQGSIADAAEAIGMPRTTLITRINNHHPELIPLTKPKRRRSILRK